MQELLTDLLDGIGVAPAERMGQCVRSSPASNEPVFYVPLTA